MVFYDSTNNSGIVDETYFITNTNSTTYPLKQVARNVNRWYDLVTSWILSCDGRWQFDDTGRTDLPIATTDLVSGQDDYTFDSTLLNILKVEAATDSTVSQFQQLTPIDSREIYNYSEFNKVDAQPRYYDIVGNSLILKPASNFNATNGLKVYFQRTPEYFVGDGQTASNAKEPGFAQLFHRILSLGAAYDWMVAKSAGNANAIRQEIEVLKAELMKFYSRRDKAERPVLRRLKQYFK